jgi:hypothetical protein
MAKPLNEIEQLKQNMTAMFALQMAAFGLQLQQAVGLSNKKREEGMNVLRQASELVNEMQASIRYEEETESATEQVETSEDDLEEDIWDAIERRLLKSVMGA